MIWPTSFSTLILPGLGASRENIAEEKCNHQVGLLWDDFKSHSCPPVKEYCQAKEYLNVLILGGGLTPVGQPLDKVINKV